MARTPLQLERPEGAEAADAFARAIAEQAADLGDLIVWDDEDIDRDAWRDRIDVDEMPASGPTLRGSELTATGARGRPQFNSFPSTATGPLLPVMTIVLPIRVGAGRPIHALQQRNRYYGLALRAAGRWLWGHREQNPPRRIELHLLTESWPLCPMAPLPGGAPGWQGLFDYERYDPIVHEMLRRIWRRSGHLPFGSDVGADAHSGFAALTRRYRNLNLEVRVKLCDRRRVVELAPFRADAWPLGW
jgi:hypothetical protein